MFTIYGHSQCTYCTSAKQELEKRSIEYTYKDIRENSEAFDKYITYGFRTVPVIVDEDRLVGGFDKLINYLEAKNLGDFDLDL